MSNAHYTIERPVSVVPEIIFRVVDDEVDGGYSASALGYGIHTQAETIPELRKNVKETVECCFDDATLRRTVMSLCCEAPAEGIDDSGSDRLPPVSCRSRSWPLPARVSPQAGTA